MAEPPLRQAQGGLPPWVCPHCYQELELASPCVADGRPPEGGDLTVCVYCGELCVLGDDGCLRRPGAADREKMNDVMVEDLIAAIHEQATEIRESIARAESRTRRDQSELN